MGIHCSKLSRGPVKHIATTVSALDDDDIRKHYQMNQEIGKGTFGLVKMCTHRETNEAYAVKIVENIVHPSGVDLKRMMEMEVQTLASLHHPNILKYYDFFQDDNFFYAVSEYCSGGELFQKIKNRESFSEEDASSIMKQIISAIRCCHDNSIMHRDVKAENFILRTTKPDSELVLIDFGFAVHIQDGERLSQVCGSPRYVAPEVIEKNYDSKADIWSAGVILYLMLYGRHPFGQPKAPVKAILNDIKTKEIQWPEHRGTEQSLSFLQGLLQKNPDARMSAAEALAHPWIAVPSRAKRLSVIAQSVVASACAAETESNKLQKGNKTKITRMRKSLDTADNKFNENLPSGGHRVHSPAAF